MHMDRFVQASQQQGYPSLQGMLHQASAAGVLGALSFSLPADKPYRLHTQLQESGLTTADKDALRSFLLEVCACPSDQSVATYYMVQLSSFDLMHSRLPSKASRGRPPKCWTDYVREDLESLKLLLNWARLAQDRDTWRNKIQDLLGHTPSTMLEMCKLID